MTIYMCKHVISLPADQIVFQFSCKGTLDRRLQVNGNLETYCPNTMLTKKMLFAKSKKPYFHDPWMNISKMLGVSIEQAKRKTQENFGFAAFVESQLNNETPWHPEC